MQIKAFIIDEFTNDCFKGNQAGVCLLDEDLEESLLLSTGKESGFSETALERKTSKMAGRFFR